AACSWDMDRVSRTWREPATPPGATRAGGTTLHGARAPRRQASELQAAFACGVGQRLDAAMVAVAGAVEGDLLDARGPGLLGDHAAHLGGGLGVLAVLQALADVGLGGAGRSQDLRAVGAEQLCVDVLAGAQHRQARDAQFADVRAGRLGAAQACGFLVHGISSRRTAMKQVVALESPAMDDRALAEGSASCLLGFLANDVLAGVLHALALVRLGRAEAADLRRHLAHALLVGTGDHDLGLGRGADGDALGDLEQHRVREPQRQVEVLALHRGAVTHAHQLELALEALGNAVHHVGDDRAQGTGDGDPLRIRVRQLRLAVLDLDLDVGGFGDRQRALRALDADALGLDVQFHALGQDDRLLGYSGHVRYSLRPRSTGLHRRRPAGAPASRS